MDRYSIPDLIARLDERTARVQRTVDDVQVAIDNLTDVCNRFFILIALTVALLHFFVK